MLGGGGPEELVLVRGRVRSRARGLHPSRSGSGSHSFGRTTSSRAAPSPELTSEDDPRRISRRAHQEQKPLALVECICLLSILTGSISVMILCFRLLPEAVSTAATHARAEWATTRTPENPRNANLLLEPPSSSASDTIYCRYDGSCPKRMICDASGNLESPGVCRPWSLTAHPLSSLATCVDACLEELTQDEHFYQNYWPAVVDAYSVKNAGAPEGCGIVYRRTKDFALKWTKHDDWNQGIELGPAVQKWMSGRFRHISRVDPFTEDLNDNRWVALCKAPCTTDVECQTPLEAINMKEDHMPPAYQCVEGSCMKNVDYWEQSETMDLVLVTAVSAGYFDALKNLVASIRYWEPEISLIVYYLGGLSAAQIAEIDSWENVLLQWRNGIPHHYPDHVHELEKFAWRPIVIHDSLVSYKSILFLEAGSALTGPLKPVEDILEREGIFLVHSHTDMAQSHPKMYHWFGTSKQEYPPRTPHFLGRAQGYLYPSRYYETVVRPNALCALDEACISPSSNSPPSMTVSSVASTEESHHNDTLHHTDRTSLSILAYHEKVRVPHHNEYFAETSGELNEDLTRPSKRVIWGKQNGNFYLQREQQIANN